MVSNIAKIKPLITCYVCSEDTQITFFSESDSALQILLLFFLIIFVLLYFTWLLSAISKSKTKIPYLKRNSRSDQAPQKWVKTLFSLVGHFSSVNAWNLNNKKKAILTYLIRFHCNLKLVYFSAAQNTKNKQKVHWISYQSCFANYNI